MNLVDPRVFKQGAGVGEWVDAMVRVQGAVVVPLAATMIGDWALVESCYQVSSDWLAWSDRAGMDLNDLGTVDLLIDSSETAEV